MERKLNLNDYDYVLDKSLIAQVPLNERTHSKLLVMDRFSGELKHQKFSDIIKFLKKGDVLVLNNTKVIPARLYGIKEKTGAKIEILLLKDLGNNDWQIIAKNQRRLHLRDIVNFNDKLKMQVTKINDDQTLNVHLEYKGILLEILNEIGIMPLPPYIHEKLKEKDRYQTVYADILGSAAAPTAGLHFDLKLLEDLKNMGVIITYVTLHVGLGTFKPVETANILDHKMHSEYYEMSASCANVLNEAVKRGNRIIAVGTTSTRVLETVKNKYNDFRKCSGWTDIFIYPGYEFKAIDGLITNFHLPKSTLMMLVSAFSQTAYILNAYEEAQNNGYRFFSFGDAMFITGVKKRQVPWFQIIDKINKEKPYLKENNYKILKGSNNIMLSAPHAHKHIRNDKTKCNEYNTGNIIKILKEFCDCHIIWSYKNSVYDPNYLENDYKKALGEYIIANDIKYLIDIHGMNDQHDYDIELGTNDGKSLDPKILNKIIEIFNQNKITNIKVNEKFKGRSKTISGFIFNEYHIPTIQIEIASGYRKLKNKPARFNRLLVSLEEIINLLKEG